VSQTTRPSGYVSRIGTETTPDGLPIPRLLPGWRTNVYVRAPIVEAFAAGLPQLDEHGKLMYIWTRTWAARSGDRSPHGVSQFGRCLLCGHHRGGIAGSREAVA